jgi:hypothetical protein
MGPELSDAGRPVMHLAATGHRGHRAAGQTSDETRGRVVSIPPDLVCRAAELHDALACPGAASAVFGRGRTSYWRTGPRRPPGERGGRRSPG